jgi:hypothetical protein
VAFFHHEVGVALALRDMDYENKKASLGAETINCHHLLVTQSSTKKIRALSK